MGGLLVAVFGKLLSAGKWVWERFLATNGRGGWSGLSVQPTRSASLDAGGTAGNIRTPTVVLRCRYH